MSSTSCTRKDYDLPNVRLTREDYDAVQNHIRTFGYTMSAFVRRAIRETMDRDARHHNDRMVRLAGE